MKRKFTVVIRVLLGLIFVASGIVGLFNLVPPPENMADDMKTFMAGMMAAKYFFPLLKITEIVCGALLMIGWFVPLALVVLAPIVVHIFFVHAVLDPSGLPVAVVLGAFLVFLSFFAEPYSAVVRRLFNK